MTKQKADLLQGTVEMLVLRLLRAGPLNGWDMMQRVALVSGDVLAVTPGSLYPALHRLEERGLVAGAWGASANGRRAKFYTLTAPGGGSSGGRPPRGRASRVRWTRSCATREREG
jgi:DNA-binding PadR family transcriptional regulator